VRGAPGAEVGFLWLDPPGSSWVVLFINLAFPAYSSSVINTYMAANLHLDRKMLGLPHSVYLIMSGLPAPLVAVCCCPENRRSRC
jgi:hypothetical protein